MASGLHQYGVTMASVRRQGDVTGLSVQGCRRQERIRMRQDASGWRQEWFTYASASIRVASAWRQDDVRITSQKRQKSFRVA